MDKPNLPLKQRITDLWDLMMGYCQNGWECVKIVELFLGIQGRGARAAHQTLNLLILVRIQAPLPCIKPIRLCGYGLVLHSGVV